MKDEFIRQHVATSKLPAPVRAKWDDDLLDEGFVPFPKKVVRALNSVFSGSPEAQELALLLAVVDFKRPNLYRNPSLEYLAFVAGLDEETARSALDRLEARSWATATHDPQTGEVVVDVSGFESAVREATKE